jgi:hypothetical protein
MRTHSFFASTALTMTIFSLGDFEDVYYATCAKLKELLQGVDLLLENGFRSPEDTYFAFHHCERLIQLNAISVGAFKASLHSYEEILNSSEVTALLNKGIMEKSIRQNEYDGQKQVIMGDEVDEEAILCRISKQTGDPDQRWHGVFQESLGLLNEDRQLQDTSRMGCGMIFGSLAEKYRSMAVNTMSDGASINREPTPDIPLSCQEVRPKSRYVSPYNLDERAKKLDIPGGPEMPCLCDPDCICVPVCASDPLQNCLCEENGLFTRVTQGMDIDDLDVPDLVRRKRHGSETSASSQASSVASFSTSVCPNQSIRPFPYEESRWSSSHWAINAVERQDMALSENNLDLSAADDDRFWQGNILTPSEASDLLFRKALTQPFSKQCEYPPKRSSMAQQLFRRRHGGVTNNQRALTLKGVKKGQAANASMGKQIKQTRRSLLVDLSFNSLKLALRRDSRVRG